MKSNFTYELVKKSNSGNSYEYNINFNFAESFSNSPELILEFMPIIFENYCSFQINPT